MTYKSYGPFLVLALSLVFLGSFTSGLAGITEGDKYDDAKAVLEKLAAHIDSFVQNMNKAEEPEVIAEVLDKFAEGMKDLVPQVNEIRDKYPELKQEDTHPEELKPLLQRLDKGFQEMMKAYAKVMENIENPAVKEADQKYKQVMSEMR